MPGNLSRFLEKTRRPHQAAAVRSSALDGSPKPHHYVCAAAAPYWGFGSGGIVIMPPWIGQGFDRFVPSPVV